VCREIPEICDSISEECRKAQFFYLRGSLSAGMNLEVNQDKCTVSTLLEKLGFTPLLIQSLDEAERLYRENATPFDLKSSLGHLRSFLEQLHVQACTAVHSRFSGPPPAKWGEALRYLQENDVLTKVEELFASQFYTLMSDTGVHPLIAERECARLMRNISIEYGLLLLTKLVHRTLSSLYYRLSSLETVEAAADGHLDIPLVASTIFFGCSGPFVQTKGERVWFLSTLRSFQVPFELQIGSTVNMTN
jgi:hypothetical protein